MPTFKYKARTSRGTEIEGKIEAVDRRTVVDKMREQSLIILDLREEIKSPLGLVLDKVFSFFKKVKLKDIALFSRQLSVLINAGVPIVQSLDILSGQVENKMMKDVVKSIKEDIETGVSISDAMMHHKNVFSELYISMVHAGEVGGILDVILERLSHYLESMQELRGRVKGAMAYPAVVLLAAMGATFFILTFAIPKFSEMFMTAGGQLPAPTRILIGLSNFLKSNVIFILLGIVGIVIGFRLYIRTPKGRSVIDNYLIKIPAFGTLIKKVAVAKFSRTLGILISSGVPILQAMETVAKTAGNKVIEEAILNAKSSIREGQKISDPLKRSGVFPPLVIAMVSVGEETGSLDSMLIKIADFYDQEVNTAVEALTSMIEPLIVIIMGLVIGGIVVALFLPMFQMSELIGG